MKTYQYFSAGLFNNVRLSFQDGLLCAVEIDQPIIADKNLSHFHTTEKLFLKACTEHKIQFTEIERVVSFDMFYEAYGNKVGKTEAIKCWDKMSKADQAAAFYFIPKYKARVKLDNVAMLYPATYLNKKRWQ